MSKDQHSYEDSLNELQTIVKEIEAGNIGIDALSEKVKRASALIKICRNKLESTEKEVSELLKGLDK